MSILRVSLLFSFVLSLSAHAVTCAEYLKIVRNGLTIEMTQSQLGAAEATFERLAGDTVLHWESDLKVGEIDINLLDAEWDQANSLGLTCIKPTHPFETDLCVAQLMLRLGDAIETPGYRLGYEGVDAINLYLQHLNYEERVLGTYKSVSRVAATGVSIYFPIGFAFWGASEAYSAYIENHVDVTAFRKHVAGVLERSPNTFESDLAIGVLAKVNTEWGFHLLHQIPNEPPRLFVYYHPKEKTVRQWWPSWLGGGVAKD